MYDDMILTIVGVSKEAYGKSLVFGIGETVQGNLMKIK